MYNSIFINGNILKKSTNQDIIATINDVNHLLNKKNSWVKTEFSNVNTIEISNSYKYSLINNGIIVVDVLSSNPETNVLSLNGISNGCISNSDKYQVLLSSINDYTQLIKILVSSNYGKTFVTSYYDFSGKQFNDVSISNTGKYILVSKNNELLYSSNYGKSNDWKSIDFVNSAEYVVFPCRFINSKLSSSGQYSIVITNSKSVYFSTDFCNNWIMSLAININENVNHVFISQTGETIAISCDSCIFISNDYGANWRLVNVPNKKWLKVISVTSTVLLAISINDLWISDETTSNWTNFIDITNVSSDLFDSKIQNGFYSNKTLILQISNTLYSLKESI
jgi:hypothetical protein